MSNDTQVPAPHIRRVPDNGFAFAAALSKRLEGHSTAPQEVIDAVALLTATADPTRAARLRPGPNEPAALVERLAVWALRRVDADTITIAHSVLLGVADRSPAALCGSATGHG